MKGQLQEVTKKDLTLKDKLHNMAETLRNCTNLKQGTYLFYQKHLDGSETYCAMGALGFRAGIPKNVLEKQPYELVLRKYGITESEESTLVRTPKLHEYVPRTRALGDAIWWMNDFGKSYNEIADWLDRVI